ncbi:MAG: hypothetical protein RBT69_06125 [Spirochaetia bacterium]|jgi:hypothetical protein|nr:hypothetical protein [Spirochaetia bacterium]
MIVIADGPLSCGITEHLEKEVRKTAETVINEKRKNLLKIIPPDAAGNYPFLLLPATDVTLFFSFLLQNLPPLV